MYAHTTILPDYMHMAEHIVVLQIACTVVAALLHYLFTAVFSWMLCEGILLYFLIVKVFSFKFTKRRWPYFIFGWGKLQCH